MRFIILIDQRMPSCFSLLTFWRLLDLIINIGRFFESKLFSLCWSFMLHFLFISTAISISHILSKSSGLAKSSLSLLGLSSIRAHSVMNASPCVPSSVSFLQNLQRIISRVFYTVFLRFQLSLCLPNNSVILPLSSLFLLAAFFVFPSKSLECEISRASFESSLS